MRFFHGWLNHEDGAGCANVVGAIRCYDDQYYGEMDVNGMVPDRHHVGERMILRAGNIVTLPIVLTSIARLASGDAVRIAFESVGPPIEHPVVRESIVSA